MAVLDLVVQTIRARIVQPFGAALARTTLADRVAAAALFVELWALKAILSTSQIHEIWGKHWAGDYTITQDVVAGSTLLLLTAVVLCAIWIVIRPLFARRGVRWLCFVPPSVAAVAYLLVLVASLIDPLAVFGSVTALAQVFLFFAMLTALLVGLRTSRILRLVAGAVLAVVVLLHYAHPNQGDRIDLIDGPRTDGMGAYERFINFRQSEFGVPDNYRCTELDYPKGYADNIDDAAIKADEMARNDNYPGKVPDTIWPDYKCLDFLVERRARGRWPEIRKSFELWLEARPDRKAYLAAHRPYPVLLVSAEGGGIYATAHAALFLARLQDACPDFAQHVFVVSSVSGGSIGSAIFSSAIAKDQPVRTLGCPTLGKPGGPHEARVARVLEQDFLSPVVDSMLGPNLVNGLFTANVVKWRRADILASSFRSAWLGQNPDMPDIWSKGVAAAWVPDGNTPAMMFNVTEVATGRRTVIAPFSSKSVWTHDWPALSRHLGDAIFLDNDDYKRGMTVATAAVSSARFPGVTPPANLPVGIPDPRYPGATVAAQFVDGGYADNSGAETLAEVVPLLRTLKADVTLNVIALAGVESQERLVADVDEYDYIFETSLPFSAYADGELKAPLIAFANARSFHADEALRQLQDMMMPDCRSDIQVSCFVAPPFIRMPIDPGTMGLPLGWTLSHASLAKIRSRAAMLGRCGATVPPMGYTVNEVGTIWVGARGNDILKDVATFNYDQAKEKAVRLKGGTVIRPDEIEAFKKGNCEIAQVQQILSGSIRK